MAGSAERIRDDLDRLADRGHGVRAFSLAAAQMLSRAVPFDGVCVLTLDPATRLPTGEVVEGGLPEHATQRMAEIEVRGLDVNPFDGLVRARRLAASLSEVTGGELDRSVRHRELRAPNGFGDELRAVLVSDMGAWGALTLLRRADRPPFTPADTALVASLSGRLAEGLRRAVLGSAIAADSPADGADVPGLLVLSADNAVAMADAAAERWLAELGPRPLPGLLPAVVVAAAGRARALGGVAPAPSMASQACVRAASGTWLTVRASLLGTDGQVGVVLEPARSQQLAPLIAQAYELTDREREVSELVAEGLATDEIAGRLCISPWTVQDHLKSIFEKVGVRTRGELVAGLFFRAAPPRLDGWDAATVAQ